MIKIACSGFPVGRKKYENRLKIVELKSLFEAFPRPSTLEKWGKIVNKDFEYIVCASKIITHPVKRALTAAHQTRATKIGYFQDSPEVRQAFQKTWHAANILGSKIVHFQCPDQLTPHPDHIQRFQLFFRSFSHDKKHIVWEPPSSWPVSLIEGLGRSLHLSPVFNPLSKHYKLINSPMRYFRLGANGKTSGVCSFTDQELKQIKAACDKPLSYVVFNNGPTSFSDAVRFQALLYV